MAETKKSNKEHKKIQASLDEDQLRKIITDYRSEKTPKPPKIEEEKKDLHAKDSSQPLEVDLEALARFLDSKLRKHVEVKRNAGDIVIREGVEVTRISKNGLIYSTSRIKHKIYQQMIREFKRKYSE